MGFSLLTALPPCTPPLPRLQLDFLLGQTQKYSTMLAERLKGEGPTAIAAEAAAAAAGEPSSSQLPASWEPSAGPGGEAQQGGVRQRPRRAARGTSPALPASAAVSGTAGALHRLLPVVACWHHAALLLHSIQLPCVCWLATLCICWVAAHATVPHSTSPMRSAEGEDSDEYRSGEDDDADNEGTIEEEEALAAAEGRDVKVRLRVGLLRKLRCWRRKGTRL